MGTVHEAPSTAGRREMKTLRQTLKWWCTSKDFFLLLIIKMLHELFNASFWLLSLFFIESIPLHIAYQCKLWNKEAIKTVITSVYHPPYYDHWRQMRWREREILKDTEDYQVEEYTRDGASTIEFQENIAEIMSTSSHFNWRANFIKHL